MLRALALLVALSTPTFALEVETIRIGESAASYYDPGSAGPGALLLHACNRDRSSWDGLARALGEAGFHVLTLDFPGYGESGGERYEGDGSRHERMVWWRAEWSDAVDAAHRWLVERPGVDEYRLVAAGASCGVLMATAVSESFPSSYRALALLSGPLDKQGYDHLYHSTIPVMAIVSGNDTPFTQYAMQQVDRSTHESSEFVLLDDAGHGTDMLAAEKGLARRIVQWMQRWTGGSSPPAPIEARRSGQ